MSTPEPQQWLIEVARSLNRKAAIPENFELSNNPLKSWQQVARLSRVSTQELAEAAADFFDMELAEISEVNVNTVRLIPEKSCRELFILPVKQTEEEIFVATCDPLNVKEKEEKLRFAIKSAQHVHFLLMSPEAIENMLIAAFAAPPQFSINLDEMGQKGSKSAELTVRLAKAILRDAVDKRASDVHIQPFGGGGMIRFRIDGVMHRIATVPLETLESLSRFFKVHGNMDPSKKMIAQDGRIRLTLENIEIDVRMSILPTFGGERIVARLLDQKRIFSMARSGYSVADQQAIKRLTSNRAGIILITGPTGSGKSSTLYSILSDMDRSQQNIMSIENPVEYVLQGISQTEVNEKQGLTFSSSLRAILRQDPDVVLVGEIRDAETARIASQAAMTGHLVLSTLHTNDSISAVTRLLKLEVDSSVLADSLLGVIAQRLVRQLCPHCKERVTEQTLTASEKLFHDITSLLPGFRAMGCEHCSYTGYMGRLPITEIFDVTPAISEMIFQGQTSHRELLEAATGFKKLSASATLLIVSGDTSIEEAFRIVGREFWYGIAKQYGKALPENINFQSDESDVLPGVLIISGSTGFVEQMTPALKKNNLTPYSCNNAVEAKVILQKQVDIAFVIAELDDRPDEELLEYVRDARLQLYWSKLPALLVLPEGRVPLESKLREDGAISKMVHQPVSAQDIVEYIESYTFAG
jgi:type IV pilus assembly protein PilB